MNHYLQVILTPESRCKDYTLVLLNFPLTTTRKHEDAVSRQ